LLVCCILYSIGKDLFFEVSVINHKYIKLSINPSIFKAYDIRGLYPQEINEEMAYAIARATARFMFRSRESKHKMVVAMDNRDSSPMLKEAVLRGLRDEGVDIIDAGVATTPMFYFAVNQAKADGGIMITASHNPARYNGLKIVSAGAQPVGQDSGLDEIKNITLNLDVKRPSEDDKSGQTEQVDFLNQYIDFLIKDLRCPSVKVAVDASCGTAGAIVLEVAKKTELALMPLCFAPCLEVLHGGDPLKDDNVKDIIEATKEQGVDLGVAFDTDGDRVFFFDKTGERVPSHIIGSLLARYYLNKYPGATIISDVRMPKIFSETVVKNGGKHLGNRVGHAFIKKRMCEENAVFAAEVSGHFYFRDFFGLDGGVFAFTRMLDILAREQKPLDELAMPYRMRSQSGELNYKVADTQKALAGLKSAFADAEKFSEIDGLSIFYKNWWCNIRPSNTEPFLRVNIEAETKEKLTEMKEKIEMILS